MWRKEREQRETKKKSLLREIIDSSGTLEL
jgi:hypothetical protein